MNKYPLCKEVLPVLQQCWLFYLALYGGLDPWELFRQFPFFHLFHLLLFLLRTSLVEAWKFESTGAVYTISKRPFASQTRSLKDAHIFTCVLLLTNYF